MAFLDYQTLVDGLIRDESGAVSVSDRDQAINLAVVRYSTDRPRSQIEAIVATGNLIDLPEDWEMDFSALQAIWLPDVNGRIPLEGRLENTLAGMRIRLTDSLATDTEVHVEYSILHEVTEASDTVPVRDREAVACWAAQLLLEQLSSLYSGHREPTIQGDTTDWQSKGRDYASRAKRLRENYLNHLGIDPKRTVPSGAVVNFNLRDQLGGDRIVHNQRRR
jgi:hypothetical protein